MSEVDQNGPIWEMALCHLDSLHGYAMALTCDTVEAEDLVQETYTQAAEHFAQLRPESNLRGWLTTIMRNCWFQHLRHRRSGPDFVALDENDDRHNGVDVDDPQLLCIKIWEREEIRVAMERLPVHYREIVLLSDIQGFKYKETAEILDCPVGTVMSRLARARSKLKHILVAGRSPVARQRGTG